MEFPDELTMIEKYGTEALEVDLDDGYYCYEFIEGIIKLRLSFNIFERSIQVSISVQNREVFVGCQEKAIRLYPLYAKGKKILRGEYIPPTEWNSALRKRLSNTVLSNRWYRSKQRIL